MPNRRYVRWRFGPWPQAIRCRPPPGLCKLTRIRPVTGWTGRLSIVGRSCCICGGTCPSPNANSMSCGALSIPRSPTWPWPNGCAKPMAMHGFGWPLRRSGGWCWPLWSANAPRRVRTCCGTASPTSPLRGFRCSPASSCPSTAPPCCTSMDSGCNRLATGIEGVSPSRHESHRRICSCSGRQTPPPRTRRGGHYQGHFWQAPRHRRPPGGAAHQHNYQHQLCGAREPDVAPAQQVTDTQDQWL
jgi:hypothetical protein